MIELTPLERIIARILVESAINKAGSYSYSELSELLEKKHGEKVNPHYGLSIPLGNVAILCNELGLPLLSVRVQYKNDKTNKTASGFYDIACELKPYYKTMNPNEVRNKELQLTRECKNWEPLLNYLDGKDINIIPEPQKTLTVAEQIEQYVSNIISQYGLGQTINSHDMINELVRKYGTNPNSILPADYCYNRISKGIDEDSITYFEFVKSGQYKVWGKDYPYNGEIIANPADGVEHVEGYCINGKRYRGKLPVYPDELHDESQDYREGKKTAVLINVHERNPVARQACIRKYGAKCFICDFDFGKYYGPDCEGLIHVHHLVMISESNGEYKVNPETDLRPVCPNCHMVLHSKKDGYTIDEVKAMIERNKK